MPASGLCFSCRPDILPGLGRIEPRHCYGSGDVPVPRGRFGGFRCSCECRNWPKEKR